MKFRETHFEEAALNLLTPFGWQVIAGPTIAPGEPAAERVSFSEAKFSDYA